MKKFDNKLFFIKSLIIFLGLIFIVQNISLNFLESSIYDYFHLKYTAYKSGSDNIALIVIDDKSIQQYRWPWQRSLYAEVINYLNEYSKPKVIGFDALLSSLDKNHPESDKLFFDSVNKANNLVVGFQPSYGDYSEGFDANSYEEAFYNKYRVNIQNKQTIKYKNIYNNLTQYPKQYFNAVKYAGSTNFEEDDKNVVRDTDQLVNINGKLYPNISLRMYMLVNNTDSITLTNKYIKIDGTNVQIPIEGKGRPYSNLIQFYKSRANSDYSHKTYSAIDVIQSYRNIKAGKKPIIDPREFKDKVVFIGANAKAVGISLEDVRVTPITTNHPGVDLQATNFDNLMQNEFVKTTTIFQDFITIFILVLVSIILILKLPFFQSLATLILVAAVYILMCIICFDNNIAPNVATPIVIQLFTMIFGYSYRFIVEGRNKEKIKVAMGKYLSQDIMKNVVQNIDDIKLGGKKAVVTVLFADIRGFTSISEKLSAEEVSVILNEYFTEIEPIISKYNGVINKFIGDAVMAIFGEPIQDINHAKNAVLCANEMLKAVDKLRDKWLFEGKPKIEIGIGINTGEAFVGNIGSEKRLEYTVIGDMVNLASRIESYNKVYKTNLLISSSTYKHVSAIADVIKISEVTIRGKAKKMDIYEVLRLT